MTWDNQDPDRKPSYQELEAENERLRTENFILTLKEKNLREGCEAAFEYVSKKITECGYGDRPMSPAAALIRLDAKLLAAMEEPFVAVTKDELVDAVKNGQMGFIFGTELIVDGFKK